MLTFFPKQFSTQAISCYVITLLLASVLFMNQALPFQFMLFGLVPIVLFFSFSNNLTMKWQHCSIKVFSKKLFTTAIVIRIVYVVFIYLYYMEMTGRPHAYSAGDELLYQFMGEAWKIQGWDFFMQMRNSYFSFSDVGYCYWLALEYYILGTHVLPARIVKCFIDAFSCVLVYNMAKRNFGESVGRMAAIFCMLMPNMWFYCGVTLKETEMAFLVLLFAERADLVLRSPKIKLVGVILPAVCILLMFTFRTALAAVMFAAFVAGLILSSGKQLELWKKLLYSSVFAVWMFATVGVEMIQETQLLWEGRGENQAVGYENRSQINSFAKYATASVFAPAIFTIPFSSMVAVRGQENQMMMNGANFIKNIMSGFTIFAMLSLLFSGEWRKHVLPIALNVGYLVVIMFSTFAHSERFHFPVLALELMFAAYGLSLLKRKHIRWYTMWLAAMCIANIGWAWIKLAGRGIV